MLTTNINVSCLNNRFYCHKVLHIIIIVCACYKWNIITGITISVKMLYNILKGIESTSSVLIQDNVSTSGTRLLRSFIQEQGEKSNNATHVLCFENSPNDVKRYLQNILNKDNITFYDHCTDCLGWNGKSIIEDGMELTSVKLVDDAENYVIIDSLSSLILRIGLLKTYRQLHAIKESEATLICLVHDDQLPNLPGMLIKLQHLFATRFQLLPSENPHNMIAESVHVRKAGKIVRSYEEFSLDAQNNLTVYESITKKKVKEFKPIVRVVPKDLTTFKMDLGESEKVARNKLVLPYLRPESGGGGGKVFYELDEADDWDEEDPDDDLDV